MSNFTPAATGTDARARIQRFGGYLSGMVMPNIGAFIALGLITALFIPDGWMPNADLAEMVGPMIIVLHPDPDRPTPAAGWSTASAARSSARSRPSARSSRGRPGQLGDGRPMLPFGGQVMILGAIILGPLSAYMLKLFDTLVAGKVKPGFEMLVDNFSIGILGGAHGDLRLQGHRARSSAGSPTGSATASRPWSTTACCRSSSVIIEPAKVLFLNNAINHGVLDAARRGRGRRSRASRSCSCWRRTPGPVLGLLLAYLFFGPRSLRPTVPAAMIIQFFGGIHEIYFPYVLMKPTTDPRHHRRRRLRASRSSRRSTWASPARRHPAASSPTWA